MNTTPQPQLGSDHREPPRFQPSYFATKPTRWTLFWRTFLPWQDGAIRIDQSAYDCHHFPQPSLVSRAAAEDSSQGRGSYQVSPLQPMV